MNVAVRSVIVGGTLLLAGEGLLQLGELLAAWRDPLRAARVGPVRDVVLVVGDGCAWGVGVPREASWPVVLDGHGGLSVRNATAPRRHSTDALRLLPQWLAEERPSVVVVSLGADDAGVTPAPWTARETELVHGRRHRWLLPELVGLSGGGVDVTALVGTWHTGELEVVFAADGRVRVGPEVGFWRARGDDLTLTVAGGAEAELRWRREARVLVLTGPLVGGTLVLEEGPRPDGAAAAARADVLAGRLADAHLRLAALRAQGVPDADGNALALSAIEGRAEGHAELPFAAESIEGGALARFEDDLLVRRDVPALRRRGRAARSRWRARRRRRRAAARRRGA